MTRERKYQLLRKLSWNQGAGFVKSRCRRTVPDKTSYNQVETSIFVYILYFKKYIPEFELWRMDPSFMEAVVMLNVRMFTTIDL